MTACSEWAKRPLSDLIMDGRANTLFPGLAKTAPIASEKQMFAILGCQVSIECVPVIGSV